MNEIEKQEAIDLLVQILQFPTISSTGPIDNSYNNCANWIFNQCKNIGLDVCIIEESLPNKPIVATKWIGSDPHLPVIVLNSHCDVVPVISESWTVPAFEGFCKDGRIYGRGAQDM